MEDAESNLNVTAGRSPHRTKEKTESEIGFAK